MIAACLQDMKQQGRLAVGITFVLSRHRCSRDATPSPCGIPFETIPGLILERLESPGRRRNSLHHRRLFKQRHAAQPPAAARTHQDIEPSRFAASTAHRNAPARDGLTGRASSFASTTVRGRGLDTVQCRRDKPGPWTAKRRTSLSARRLSPRPRGPCSIRVGAAMSECCVLVGMRSTI